jgi:hypothetical protein
VIGQEQKYHSFLEGIAPCIQPHRGPRDAGFFQCRRCLKPTSEHWLKESRKENDGVAENGIELYVYGLITEEAGRRFKEAETRLQRLIYSKSDGHDYTQLGEFEFCTLN